MFINTTLCSKNLENWVRLVRGMLIKDCQEGDLESIAVVGNRKDGIMKSNQDGVLKIAENEAAESINDSKIKRPRNLTGKGL